MNKDLWAKRAPGTVAVQLGGENIWVKVRIPVFGRLI